MTQTNWKTALKCTSFIYSCIFKYFIVFLAYNLWMRDWMKGSLIFVFFKFYNMYLSKQEKLKDLIFDKIVYKLLSKVTELSVDFVLNLTRLHCVSLVKLSKMSLSKSLFRLGFTVDCCIILICSWSKIKILHLFFCISVNLLLI